MSDGGRRSGNMIGEAFWQDVYDEHGGALFAFLASRLQRREEAEDLLHETFVRAIGARGGVRDTGKIRSYLFTIAHHLLINRFRRRRQLLFSELSEADLRPLEVADARAESPEDRTVLAAMRQRLEAAVAALPENYRRAFSQAVLEGCSYQEIAAREGWSVVHVRVNVHRARQRLVELLGDVLTSGEERVR